MRRSTKHHSWPQIVSIQKVDSLRFLGVCIDHHINYEDHITHISNKLTKSIAIINRTSHILDTKVMYCLYNAIFQPHLNNCIEVWGNTYENYIIQVFIPQKSNTNCQSRYIIGPYFTNVSPIRHFEDIRLNRN